MLGVKFNGQKSVIRVTFLVNVIDHEVEKDEESPKESSRVKSREEMLEELPIHSKRDESLVEQAETVLSSSHPE